MKEVEADNRKIIPFNIYGCARCGRNHERLDFKKFSYPVTDSDKTTWDWWALCPSSGEPILLRHQEENK